jgi:hypothetical protein
MISAVSKIRSEGLLEGIRVDALRIDNFHVMFHEQLVDSFDR